MSNPSEVKTEETTGSKLKKFVKEWAVLPITLLVTLFIYKTGQAVIGNSLDQCYDLINRHGLPPKDLRLEFFYQQGCVVTAKSQGIGDRTIYIHLYALADRKSVV